MSDPAQFTYWFVVVAVSAIGLSIGSFLNALEYRIRHHISIVRAGSKTAARSMCPHCKHQLSFADLLPIVSYLWLRGRCRYCHKPIHWQYPAVEFAAAVLLGVTAAYFGPSIHLLIVGFFAMALLFIFIYDLKYQLILDGVTLPLIPMAFILSLVRGYAWPDLALGALVGGAFFAFQYLVSRGKWIGGGDIRLGVLMGVMLGLWVTVAALFVAYIVGALVAIVLLARQKAGLQTHLAFGTFLSGATFICLLYGPRMVEWYVSFLL
jgi:prepilin signal peptidase PulO-like enzyme (type II secretory pathway)